MTALFATNWDDEYSPFENIAKIRHQLLSRSFDFRGKHHWAIVRQITDLRAVEMDHYFGLLDEDETQELISEQLKELSHFLSSPVEEEKETKSNVIPFPTHLVRYKHFENQYHEIPRERPFLALVKNSKDA